jgi:hypothetical protein
VSPVVYALIAVAILVLAGSLGARWQKRVSARRQRERDLALAQRWDAMERLRATTPGAGLIGIVTVYQRARRGTKAVIMWLETGREQDAWFAANWPSAGSVALVRGSTGWGPHNQNPDVFYVQPSQVLDLLPPGTPEAVERHRARVRASGFG